MRRKAAQSLCQTPNPKALAPLATALRDSDAEVRRLAATALGKLDEDERLDPLLAALRDPDAGVQKAAIVALKRFSGDQAIASLVPLLRDADADVRGHAAQVLQLLGWRPESRDDEIWFWAAKGQFPRVAAFGAAAIPALEAVLDSGSYSLSVGAIQALGVIPDQRVLRPLFRALKSGDAAVCVAAVDALARVGGAQAIEPLSAMFRHQNAQVRLAAIEAAGSLRATGSLEALRGLLNDPVWDVRRAAAETLGRLKDPAAVEALTQTLGDSDADVREATALSLGRLMDRRALGPLVMTLKDPTSGVRRIAAAALSRIDPDWSSAPEAQPALEALRPALEDGDSEVRHFVGHLLAGLGASEAGPAGNTVPDTMSFDITERRRKLAVSLFLAILCDVDRDLRQAAAEALGQLGDPRSESGLMRAIGDADSGVRAAAEHALQRMQSANPPAAG